MKHIILSILAIALFGCVEARKSELTFGAERIDLIVEKLGGKRVGLIVNQTSVVGESQVHLIDTLLSCGVDVVKVFAPEHGFRGDADAGELVSDGRDVKSGLPVVSLYGANRRPSEAQLEDVDILLFDIQDVGVRFYTYISTLYYAMQSCAAYSTPIIVLDRPNPNDVVDGPMMQEELKSFVGALSIPILHGLTVCELAQMIVGEGWLGDKSVDLTVVPMVGWRHGDSYQLPIKPSPNLPNSQSIALYPSLCLFEATNVSVGRGTLSPFQVIGFPDSKYGGFSFTPEALEGFDKNPMHKGKACYGLDLREVAPPVGFSLSYFISFMNISGEGADFISRPDFFDKLVGDPALKQQLADGLSEADIRATWQEGLDAYKVMRKKYLLYKGR
ncbi:MAG: DUF1343 domain-containing protein [Rikenellaceae bacterium]